MRCTDLSVCKRISFKFWFQVLYEFGSNFCTTYFMLDRKKSKSEDIYLCHWFDFFQTLILELDFNAWNDINCYRKKMEQKISYQIKNSCQNFKSWVEKLGLGVYLVVGLCAAILKLSSRFERQDPWLIWYPKTALRNRLTLVQ